MSIFQRKKKTYKFSDEVMSRDAIISLIFGVPAFIAEVGSGVYSIVKLGNVIEQMGAIILASGIMALTALFFSLISFGDTECGIMGKRWALALSLVDIALIVIIYILGTM